MAHHSRNRLPLLMATVLLVLVALLAGCGSQAAAPKPELDVTLEQVGKDLMIKMETRGFKVPNDGHLHLRLDDGPEAMPYTTTYKIPNVAPGKHTVTVELSDVEHMPIGVKVIKEIEIK